MESRVSRVGEVGEVECPDPENLLPPVWLRRMGAEDLDGALLVISLSGRKSRWHGESIGLCSVVPSLVGHHRRDLNHS